MRLHNMSIEPEHLMLGIIRDGKNHAFRILQNELLFNVPHITVQMPVL